MASSSRSPDLSAGGDGRAPAPGWAELAWALRYARPYWRSLAVVATLGLVGTLSALALPFLSKGLVDRALLGRDGGELVRILVLFAVLVTLGFVVNAISGLRYTRISAEILFDMRLDLYRHLQGLSPRFYARTPIGEILSRLNNDIGEIQRIVAESALGWLGHVVFLIGTVAILVWLDARLFALSLVALPPALLALVLYRRRLEPAVAALRRRSAAIGTFLVETLRGMRLVVTANAQEREAERFRRANDAFIDALMQMSRLNYVGGALPGVLLSLGMLVLFFYGGHRVIAGTLTMGTLVAFVAYQTRLLSPIQGLMGLYTNLAVARVSLGRVHEILEVAPEVVEAADAVPLASARGALRFERVSLSHGERGAILREADFEVAPGETVAIVGPSGCGKSTLADLAVRLLDPDSGRVLLDGHDLLRLRLRDVRRAVAVVDHAPFVLHASLAENLRYGLPDASEEAVREALERAGLRDLAERLPHGLATTVGESGRQLSAGERQRVAIARALLTEPAVLVFDEATATLDPAAEGWILSDLDARRGKRTTLLITHRLELARRADRIVLLEGGRVMAAGASAELLAAEGPVRSFFRTASPASTPAAVAASPAEPRRFAG